MTTAQNPSFGTALPFKPSTSQLLRGKPAKVPRYLLRLYCPSSKGNTTQDVVESHSVVNGSPLRNTDLFKLPEAEAADMLNKHLWWINDLDFDDNLMSWTTSFMVVIQHGLRRHSQDGVELADLHICIVDTRKFPVDTFIHDMYLLDAFVNHPKIRTLLGFRRGQYYFGEYLSQGRLDIRHRSSHVSLQTLITLGLYQLEPRFQHGQDLWAKRVVALREPFGAQNQCIGDVDETELRRAMTMGQAFGDEYALPVLLMLLSLSPRRADDQALFRGIKAMFTDKEIASARLETLHFDGDRLPEVKQFGDIVRKLHEKLTENAGHSAAIQPQVARPFPGWQEINGALNDIVTTELSDKVYSTLHVKTSQYVGFVDD